MKLYIKSVPALAGILFIFILFLFSCNKETSGNSLSQQQQQDASFNAAESNADAESIFNNVFDNVMGVNNQVGLQGTGVFGRVATVQPYLEKSDSIYPVSCFVIDINSLNPGSVFPLSVTIDFGSGCQGKDGRIRKGKIITIYSNRLILPGATATTTFNGFYIDSINVTGTHTVTNTGDPTMRQFSIDVTGAKLTSPNGNYTAWECHKTITQIAGLATPDYPLDDVFAIDGNSEGTIKYGDWLMAWNSHITEPLIKEFLCHWIIKGKIETVRNFSGNNRQWVAELDFGSGSCDGLATITVNGVTREISLR
jgi:hypothetical protein